MKCRALLVPVGYLRPGCERPFELADEPIVIGRDAGVCTYSFSDESLSRFHALFVPDEAGEGHWVLDLGSTNGVLVEGTRCGSFLLRGGENLLLGKQAFLYKRMERAVAAGEHRGRAPELEEGVRVLVRSWLSRMGGRGRVSPAVFAAELVSSLDFDFLAWGDMEGGWGSLERRPGEWMLDERETVRLVSFIRRGAADGVSSWLLEDRLELTELITAAGGAERLRLVTPFSSAWLCVSERWAGWCWMLGCWKGKACELVRSSRVVRLLEEAVDFFLRTEEGGKTGAALAPALQSLLSDSEAGGGRWHLLICRSPQDEFSTGSSFLAAVRRAMIMRGGVPVPVDIGSFERITSLSSWMRTPCTAAAWKEFDDAVSAGRFLLAARVCGEEDCRVLSGCRLWMGPGGAPVPDLGRCRVMPISRSGSGEVVRAGREWTEDDG